MYKNFELDKVFVFPYDLTMETATAYKLAQNKVLSVALSIWSYRVVRGVIGVIFLWAGIVKLLDVDTFASTIYGYGLVPEFSSELLTGQVIKALAIGIPAIEIIAGAALLFDLKGSLTIITGLLVFFLFVLWFGILNDLQIDCGCFSRVELDSHAGFRLALYRDFVMLGGAAYLFGWRYIQRSVFFEF